jgi:hypothetical protein
MAGGMCDMETILPVAPWRKTTSIGGKGQLIDALQNGDTGQPGRPGGETGARKGENKSFSALKFCFFLPSSVPHCGKMRVKK